ISYPTHPEVADTDAEESDTDVEELDQDTEELDLDAAGLDPDDAESISDAEELDPDAEESESYTYYVEELDPNAEESDSESTSTLLNCSLVCSSFRYRVQKRLFNDVFLHFPSSFIRQRILMKVLLLSARLRAFVVKLHLMIDQSIDNIQLEFNLTFPNLTDLKIDGGPAFPSNCNFAEAPWSSLSTLMGSSLHTLAVRIIKNFPLSALGKCSQLEGLSTDRVDYNDKDFPLSTSPVPQIYLRTIRSFDDTFHKLVMALVNPSFPLSAARLQKLSLFVSNRATAAALKVISDEAGAYLDDLELCFKSGMYLSHGSRLDAFTDSG
ncbi:hypothetical protein C0993_008482, partial [Termitomyces sp. T159_Od127]